MRTDEDELEAWMERPLPGSPLAKLVQERLASMPLAEDDVDAAVERAMRRLGARPRSWWRPAAVSAGLAMAAALAFALWPRPPDRPEIAWAVQPVSLGAVAAEAVASADPEALAASLLEQGRPEDAAQIYRWLLAKDPAGPASARWQEALVRSLVAAGDRESAWTETLALRDRYGAGSPWASHWGSAGDLVSDAVKGQALYWHDAGRKPVDAALLERAGVAYEMYLADVPAGPRDDEMRYSYGELLYTSERFDEAWEQYRAVYQGHPDSKHARFCAESAFFAAEKLAAEHPGEQAPSPWEERVVESVEALGELEQNEEKLAQFEYRAAYMLATREQFQRSSEHFDRVIELAPGSREAQYAADLVVDMLVKEGDWAALETRAQSWLEQDWPDEELRERLLAVLAEAARQDP